MIHFRRRNTGEMRFKFKVLSLIKRMIMIDTLCRVKTSFFYCYIDGILFHKKLCSCKREREKLYLMFLYLRAVGVIMKTRISSIVQTETFVCSNKSK